MARSRPIRVVELVSTSPPQALADAEIPKAALEVLERLKAAGHQAFLVGGCVRDLLRGATPKDFDLATSARPEEVQRVFPKTLPTGIEHGTVTVRLRGESLEVTTFRTEGAYLDGRRPSEVHFRTEITEDLGRRDFTFNAMAFDPIAQRFVDPFGGQEDLKARCVRCVRDPLERFHEDGLRTLRAVRFAAVLDCVLDPATEAAIPGALRVFRKVALERVQVELEKLLLSPRAGWGLELLARTGLLEAILPELSPLEPSLPMAVQSAPSRIEVRLALLFSLSGRAHPAEALRRLKFANRVVDRVSLLVAERELRRFESSPEADLRRFLSRVGLEPLPDLIQHARAWTPEEDRPRTEQAVRRLQDVAHSAPPLSTRDLALNGARIMEVLEVRPSPIVGEASRFLLEQVLGDPALNTPEKLAEMLRDWASKRPS